MRDQSGPIKFGRFAVLSSFLSASSQKSSHRPGVVDRSRSRLCGFRLWLYSAVMPVAAIIRPQVSIAFFSRIDASDSGTAAGS